MTALMIISFLQIMCGTSIILIWIMNLSKNTESDLSGGFFRAREKESRNIFWFHIVAELITGIALIASGIILLSRDFNLYPVVYFALGALFYSSLNSLGWAFANKERYVYIIPMTIGLVISLAGMIILIL